MAIQQFYTPNKFYTTQNKFVATPLLTPDTSELSHLNLCKLKKAGLLTK